MLAYLLFGIGVLVALACLVSKPRAIGPAFISASIAGCSLVYALGLPVDHKLVSTALCVCVFFIAILVIRNTKKTQIATALMVAVSTLSLLGAGIVVAYDGDPQTKLVVSENGETAEYNIKDKIDENRSKSITKDIELASNRDDESSDVIYYANNAIPGTNEMGPRQSFASVDDALNRFGEKLFKDPLYAATIKLYLIQGKNLDQTNAQKWAVYFANREEQKEQNKFASDLLNKIKFATLADFGNTKYHSLGMIPAKNKDGMPTLTKFSTLQNMQETLVIKFTDGSSIILRVICDLQPSIVNDFEKVAPPKKPEKVVNTPPETYTPPTKTTTPPPVTTTKTTTPPPPVTTTKTTTPPPVTTTKTTTPPPVTTPTCPPQYPNCKDPKAGPDAPKGHTTAKAPVDEPEKVLPPEPKPMNPTVTTEAPTLPEDEIVAPNATPPSVEERKDVQEVNPPVTEVAPEPEQPGTTITDPDAPVDTQTTDANSGNTPAETQETQQNEETHQAPAPTDAPETETPAIELKSNDYLKAGMGDNVLMSICTIALLAVMALNRRKKI